MTSVSGVRGFAERVEFGASFIFVRGWLAEQDLSRLREPVTLRISGFGDWVIEKLSFRQDLLDAGIGDGWAAFYETIPLQGSESAPTILAARSQGDFVELNNKHISYQTFVPRGGLEKSNEAEIRGWVFDPELARRNAQPQLYLNGKLVLDVELNQTRTDLPFDPKTDQRFGFRVPIETINKIASSADTALAKLSLVTSGVEVANLQIDVRPAVTIEPALNIRLKVDQYSTFKTGILLQGWACNDDMSPIEAPLIFMIGTSIVVVEHLYARGDLEKKGIGAGKAGFSIFFEDVKSDKAGLSLTCVSQPKTVSTSLSAVKSKEGSVERKVSVVGEEVIVNIFDPDEKAENIAIWIDDTEIGPLTLKAPSNGKKIWKKSGVVSTTASVNIEWLVRRYRDILGNKLKNPAEPRKIAVVADGSRVLAETTFSLAKTFRGRIDRYDERGLRGWLTTGDGQTLAEYEVLINGVPFRKGVANIRRGDLADKGIVRRGGGFVVPIVNPTGDATIDVNVRAAGRSLPIAGGPLSISDAPRSRSRTESAYAVHTMAASVGISIIVPIYNAADDLTKCIASLRTHTPSFVRIILIDDCSPDPAIQKILSGCTDMPNWSILKNDINLGFTKTVNRGIAEAPDDDVIFLNSDTIVTPGWVQGLRVAAYSSARIATATPLSNAAGVFSVPEINIENNLPDGYDLDSTARLVRHHSMASYPRVPTGNGFCMYVRRDCINDIGPLDSVAFPVGYGEENDFCMRAVHRGYEHVMDDRTYIYHKRSASFGSKKSEHYEQGRATLKNRYPEYSGLTAVFSEAPDVLAVRWRARAAFAATNFPVLPRVLFVIATTTGGTPQTNADLMSALQDRYEGWILQCDSETIRLYKGHISQETLISQVRFAPQIDPRVHKSQEYNSAVFEILVKFSFELVHVRHIAWHSLDLPKICKSLNLPVVFSFHDFYAACPTIKLLDESGTFCGGKCTETSGDCSVELWDQSKFPKLKNLFVHRWREMFSQTMAQCDAFVTTSAFAKETLVSSFENLRDARFQVIPHGRNFESFHSMAKEPVSKGPLKILVPGNISKAKGAGLIAELSIMDKGEHFEFHILGDHGRLIQGPGLIFHGTYKREEFAEKAEKIGASVGAVLSKWPETYCHTLTELWSIGVPVIGFDIGAVGERIQAHKGGWRLDLQSTVDGTYEFLLKLASDHAEIKSRVSEVLEWQTGYGSSYDTTSMAAQYDEIYIDLLTKRIETKNA
jgi:GT2 family glycosyltransferase/glycosyltransferase involved in cell wall biosynthesis